MSMSNQRSAEIFDAKLDEYRRLDAQKYQKTEDHKKVSTYAQLEELKTIINNIKNYIQQFQITNTRSEFDDKSDNKLYEILINWKNDFFINASEKIAQLNLGTFGASFSLMVEYIAKKHEHFLNQQEGYALSKAYIALLNSITIFCNYCNILTDVKIVADNNLFISAKLLHYINQFQEINKSINHELAEIITELKDIELNKNKIQQTIEEIRANPEIIIKKTIPFTVNKLVPNPADCALEQGYQRCTCTIINGICHQYINTTEYDTETITELSENQWDEIISLSKEQRLLSSAQEKLEKTYTEKKKIKDNFDAYISILNRILLALSQDLEIVKGQIIERTDGLTLGINQIDELFELYQENTNDQDEIRALIAILIFNDNIYSFAKLAIDKLAIDNLSNQAADEFFGSLFVGSLEVREIVKPEIYFYYLLVATLCFDRFLDISQFARIFEVAGKFNYLTFSTVIKRQDIDALSYLFSLCHDDEHIKNVVIKILLNSESANQCFRALSDYSGFVELFKSFQKPYSLITDKMAIWNPVLTLYESPIQDNEDIKKLANVYASTATMVFDWNDFLSVVAFVDQPEISQSIPQEINEERKIFLDKLTTFFSGIPLNGNTPKAKLINEALIRKFIDKNPTLSQWNAYILQPMTLAEIPTEKISDLEKFLKLLSTEVPLEFKAALEIQFIAKLNPLFSLETHAPLSDLLVKVHAEVINSTQRQSFLATHAKPEHIQTYKKQPCVLSIPSNAYLEKLQGEVQHKLEDPRDNRIAQKQNIKKYSLSSILSSPKVLLLQKLNKIESGLVARDEIIDNYLQALIKYIEEQQWRVRYNGGIVIDGINKDAQNKSQPLPKLVAKIYLEAKKALINKNYDAILEKLTQSAVMGIDKIISTNYFFKRDQSTKDFYQRFSNDISVLNHQIKLVTNTKPLESVHDDFYFDFVSNLKTNDV